ncbi:hypothetical protein HaLaN_31202, partial [Haematococcus lacustris]
MWGQDLALSFLKYMPVFMQRAWAIPQPKGARLAQGRGEWHGHRLHGPFPRLGLPSNEGGADSLAGQ